MCLSGPHGRTSVYVDRVLWRRRAYRGNGPGLSVSLLRGGDFLWGVPLRIGATHKRA
jgi:hypothetical protein